MKIRSVIQYLESLAPPAYQESYDNAGLIVGYPDTEITGVLCCLDSTEAVVAEAVAKNCNLIVAHHPIVFKGLKRFNGRNYVERVVMQAIKNDIAVYAIHTNLDNMLYRGVNTRIGEQLGLQNTRILTPKKNIKKVIINGPETGIVQLSKKLEKAELGYVQAGKSSGIILRKNAGKRQGYSLEMVFPSAQKSSLTRLFNQPEMATNFTYEISSVDNPNLNIGSGMIGELPEAVPERDFLKYLKDRMRVSVIKHTVLLNKPVKKIAWCGGAGGFLLRNAISQKADIFITADYKYHEYFDADGRIVIADIGHYESEQFTIDLLHEVISQKFRNFATHLTEVNTNPVRYFV